MEMERVVRITKSIFQNIINHMTGHGLASASVPRARVFNCGARLTITDSDYVETKIAL